MDAPFVHLSVNIPLKPENINRGMFIFAGFYCSDRTKTRSGSFFTAFAEIFRCGSVTFPLDGQQKTVGGRKSDPFGDLRNTQRMMLYFFVIF